MSDEIINRVANSKLVTIDLEDFYADGNRVIVDIKDWLYQALILKEKDFREQVNNHDWSQYQNSYVALSCSSEAIIPSWAYLLITTKLANYAKKVVVGDLTLLETVIYQEIIEQLDMTNYKNKSVIIKGCSNKPIPISASVMLTKKLLPVAKAILYGEACSTVPLFKKKEG
ncbi:DUF2480 family protein [Tenacibaculum sp. UWU-22]|uniref:DUF2480 family protein n=1 Tax=Tenacibaculum sp. UWU-22 TaxID=3234187 RepID=UPI0034DB1FFD